MIMFICISCVLDCAWSAYVCVSVCVCSLLSILNLVTHVLIRSYPVTWREITVLNTFSPIRNYEASLASALPWPLPLPPGKSKNYRKLQEHGFIFSPSFGCNALLAMLWDLCWEKSYKPMSGICGYRKFF